MPDSCKFSTKHYLETINLYRDNGYRIGPVGDYFRNDIYYKHVLLRHDVDLSLDYALDMALLEKDNDIHTTYYILLNTGLYNTLSPQGRERVKDIKKAGHEIGLHIDSRYYQGPAEFDILSSIIKETVTTWCQHLITITPPIGLPNDAAKIPNYKYMSDSGMNWREGCWHNHVNKFDKLQILIHPEWTMVSPKGDTSRWDILAHLQEDAKLNITLSFWDFRDMVQEYIQTVKA